MSLDENLLSQIMEKQNQEYFLHYKNKTYVLENVTIAKFPMPVNKPTTRGGVYSISDKEYKIKGTIHDTSLVPFISKMMLGPNAEFEEIQITTKILHEGKIKMLTLFAYLTNAMNNSSKIEFNLLLVRTNIN
ncbi:MAG TPA: hypothetical protein VLB45_05490 [Nitrosopumilaceae archaeon]|nr:hypothetical protein [Nitrosopumilaceae archaeon]